MITKKGIMSMLKIHLGLGTKHMNQQISTASEACSCKRCTCPHPAGQYHSVRMNSLGKDQVFCSECNDICMTDSRIVWRIRCPSYINQKKLVPFSYWILFSLGRLHRVRLIRNWEESISCSRIKLSVDCDWQWLWDLAVRREIWAAQYRRQSLTG